MDVWLDIIKDRLQLKGGGTSSQDEEDSVLDMSVHSKGDTLLKKCQSITAVEYCTVQLWEGRSCSDQNTACDQNTELTVNSHIQL